MSGAPTGGETQDIDKGPVESVSAIQDWCNIFRKDSPVRARVVLANIVYDCTHGRLPLSVLRTFREQFAKVWKARRSQPDSGGPRVDGMVAHIVRENPQAFLCQGNDQPDPANCSRVVDARDLIERNVDLKKAGWSIPDDIEHRIEQLERKGLHKLAQGELRGRLPLAWVTKTAKIDSLRKTARPQQLADDLRDALGLRHFYDDQYLAEIVYPPRTPATLRAPTFLEGDGALEYRSTRGSDQWGRTVNLKTLREGLPEAVHQPVAFSAEYKVRRVGRLTQYTGVELSELARWKGCAGCMQAPAHICEVQQKVDESTAGEPSRAG